MLDLLGVKEDGGGDVGRRMIFIIFLCVLHLISSKLRLSTVSFKQGSKLSDKLLETFAEKLEGVFIQGELCISDWDVDKGADIKVGIFCDLS